MYYKHIQFTLFRRYLHKDVQGRTLYQHFLGHPTQPVLLRTEKYPKMQNHFVHNNNDDNEREKIIFLHNISLKIFVSCCVAEMWNDFP